MSSSTVLKSVNLVAFSLSLGLLLPPLCFAGQGTKKPQAFQSVTKNTPKSSSDSIPRTKLNQAVLAEFDADGNSKLSRKERNLFIKAMRNGTIESETLNSLLLQHFDQNENGKLERKEIAQMRRRSSNRRNSPNTLAQFSRMAAASTTDDDDSTDTDSESNGMCEGGGMGAGMLGELGEQPFPPPFPPQFPPPPPRGRGNMPPMGEDISGGDQSEETSAASFGGGGRGGGRRGR